MPARLSWLAALVLVACGGRTAEVGPRPGGGQAQEGPSGPSGPTPPPAPPAAAAQLRAGAAAVDITPPLWAKVPLAGYGGAPRRVIDFVTVPLHANAVAGECWDPDPSTAATLFAPAKGVHDPLMARALILDTGSSRLAIVKFDAIAMVRELRDGIAAAAARLGIPDEAVMVTATHTHSGPGAMSHRRIWQLIASDCYNEANFRRVLAGAVSALEQAHAQLRPAALGIGATQVQGASKNRSDRPAIIDREMGLLKIVDVASGTPIAAVLDFAVHGTAFGPKNMMFSADVMGVAERGIEAGLGGGVAVFLNGAEGDISPMGGLAAGDAIAQAYLDAWPAVATKPQADIAAALLDVKLPPPTFNVGCPEIPFTGETACEVIPGFSLQIGLFPPWLAEVAPFQAVRIDRTVFAAVPGEPITEIGWAIKKRALDLGFDRAFVVGLANEYIGYITTRDEYARGQYEATGTLHGPGTGEFVVDQSERSMAAVRP